MIKTALSIIIIIAVAFIYFGCDLGQIRKQKSMLSALVDDNVDTKTVEETLHTKFEYLDKGSPSWVRMFQQYKEGSRLDKLIATKMQNSTTVGVTSTETMLTYIFVDAKGKLRDFVVTSQ